MSIGGNLWRPTRHRIGKMRERITVQSATVDASTGETIRTWSNLYASEPAAYDPASGGETVRGRQVEANINAVFTVHYRSDYSTEYRVTYGGNAYGIVSVLPVQGGRRYLELHCKSIAD